MIVPRLMRWPDGRGPHRCAAFDCRRSVPWNWCMCRAHWLAVPAPLQERVYLTWGGHGWRSWPFRTAVRAAAIALYWAKS